MQFMNQGRLPGIRLSIVVMPAVLLLLGGCIVAIVRPSPMPVLLPASGVLVAVAWVWGSSSSRRAMLSHDMARLQAGDARFRAMLEGLPNIAVQGYDRQRRVIFWNKESAKLYGYSEAQAKGRQLEELIIPEAMRSQLVSRHQAWVVEGKPIPAGELVLRHRSGVGVPVYSYHVMLGEASGNPVMFCVDVPLDRKPA